MEQVVRQEMERSKNNHYRKILVGYDGSGASKRALLKAASLAKMVDAELRIIVVYELARTTKSPQILVPTRPRFDSDAEEEKLREGALDKSKKAVEEAKKFLSNTKISSCVANTREGNPSQLILLESESFGADLIVVGSRGLSALDRFILGSVSTAIVNRSTADVLVVK